MRIQNGGSPGCILDRHPYREHRPAGIHCAAIDRGFVLLDVAAEQSMPEPISKSLSPPLTSVFLVTTHPLAVQRDCFLVVHASSSIPFHCYSTVIVTRRFDALPWVVSLVATGAASPYPLADTWSGATPLWIRILITLSARCCE